MINGLSVLVKISKYKFVKRRGKWTAVILGEGVPMESSLVVAVYWSGGVIKCNVWSYVSLSRVYSLLKFTHFLCISFSQICLPPLALVFYQALKETLAKASKWGKK